jgi:aminobenzoyl-glutamate utilization protein B
MRPRIPLHPRSTLTALILSGLLATPASGQDPAPPAADTRLSTLMEQVEAGVAARARLAQVMVDKIFSFSELGTRRWRPPPTSPGSWRRTGSRWSGGWPECPVAWFARWGQGDGPVISFGSDIDGIPKANQKPGVAYHDPLVEGAPGHGEGHNSGQAVNVAAALALKEVMEREGIAGTLVLWPGVAEEQLGEQGVVRPGRDSWRGSMRPSSPTWPTTSAWTGDRGTAPDWSRWSSPSRARRRTPPGRRGGPGAPWTPWSS